MQSESFFCLLHSPRKSPQGGSLCAFIKWASVPSSLCSAVPPRWKLPHRSKRRDPPFQAQMGLFSGEKKKGPFLPRARAAGKAKPLSMHSAFSKYPYVLLSLSLSLVLCLQPKEKDMKQRKPQKKRFAGSLMIAGASEKDSSVWERKSFLACNIISAIASWKYSRLMSILCFPKPLKWNWWLRCSFKAHP